MGKTHSKLLAALQGRGTAWSEHGMGTACYVWIDLKSDFGDFYKKCTLKF